MSSWPMCWPASVPSEGSRRSRAARSSFSTVFTDRDRLKQGSCCDCLKSIAVIPRIVRIAVASEQPAHLVSPVHSPGGGTPNGLLGRNIERKAGTSMSLHLFLVSAHLVCVPGLGRHCVVERSCLCPVRHAGGGAAGADEHFDGALRRDERRAESDRSSGHHSERPGHIRQRNRRRCHRIDHVLLLFRQCLLRSRRVFPTWRTSPPPLPASCRRPRPSPSTRQGPITWWRATAVT